MRRLLLMLTVLLACNKLNGQSIDLQTALANKRLVFSSTTSVQSIQNDGKKGINCKNNVWLKNKNFSYGTIELDIRGRNAFLSSFPGIAFHASDTSKNYDVVYFRPFNFRSPNPVRRTWSVQYCSLPDYPWDRLRKENKGQFENEILPNPNLRIGYTRVSSSKKTASKFM